MKLSKESEPLLASYLRNNIVLMNARTDMRNNYEYVDREIARKNDLRPESRKARLEQRRGNKTILQDITVPVMQPQSETAHAYLCGVFLSGYPIFGTVADPVYQDAADQMDAVMTDHQIKGQWVRNIAKSLYDGIKYNVQAVEVCWESRKASGLKNGPNGLSAAPITWEGNTIKRLDPYNTFWDVRVPIANVHTDGEFAGYIEVYSRIRFMKLMANLPESGRQYNATTAFECGEAERHYYIPNVTDKQEQDPSQQGFNWMGWAGMPEASKLSYKSSYEVTTLYAWIVPRDFKINVPADGTPQLWKFMFVNSTVCIFAEKQTFAHGYLPIVFGSPKEDGLDYQTQSFAENLTDVQGIASALFNIRIAGARRAVSDRAIYNPEYISASDINSSNPAAKIPVRPNRYLDNLNKAFYQIPYDGTPLQSVIPDAMNIMEFGRSISGISKPLEGQFLKGNRTLGEYDDVRGNGDQRMQMIALLLQDQFFVPIKEILKSNSLQYLKIGSVSYNGTSVNPQALQDAALNFKLSDGLLPTSKIADLPFLQSLLQVFQTNQQMAAEFDVVKVISYLASLRNVPNLENFRRAPPQNIPNAAAPGITQPGGVSAAPPGSPPPGA